MEPQKNPNLRNPNMKIHCGPVVTSKVKYAKERQIQRPAATTHEELKNSHLIRSS